jgi:Carbohydrate binding domain
MTLPARPLPVVVEILVDAVWTDITGHVYVRDSIQITRGRSNESSRVEASRCSLTLNNRDGRYSPRNPLSPYFGLIGRNTPIRVSVDADVRFVGEVSEWPVAWDKPGTDVWVQVEAAGVLRRLGQGIKPLRSTMYRALTAAGQTEPPVQYWPCEDLTDATAIASAVPGAPSMRMLGARELASFDGFACSAPLPKLDLTGGWVGSVPAYTPVTGLSAVQFLFHIDTGVVDQEIMVIHTKGTVARFNLAYVTGGGLELSAFDADSNVLGSTGTLTPGGVSVDGRLFYVGIQVDQNGSDVDYSVRVLEVGGSGTSLASDTVTGETVGRILRVYTNPHGNLVAGSDRVTFGHISVRRAGTTISSLSDEVNAYAGEAAGRRVERLCGENDIGVSFINIGNLDETAAMGPQRPGALVGLLGECADADLGILYEPRDNLALTYRTRLSLYNQDPALELDYSAGVFAGLPEPVDDDQQTRNDITATRQEGSSVRAVLSSGPLSVLDPPDGVGTYDTEVTVNVVGDGFLPEHASWLLALGTVDEARYPRLPLGLHIPAFTFSTTSNLAAPGTFEATLESWAAGGSVPPTVTRDSTRAHSGSWSMKIVWGTGGLFPQSAKTFSGLTIGTRYQVSGWAWVTADSPAVRFAVATVSPAGPSTVTEGAWERFTFRFTATATSHSLQVWPARDPVSGESAWIDDITFQESLNGDDATGLDLGDLIVVSNLPAWLPPDDVAQLAQGFTEALTPVTWGIEVNCVPASPYQISLYQSATGSSVHKYASAGSELASGVTSSATTLSVATTIKPVWTADNAEDGFDVMVGGERMTVTDISGTSSPQTFTVTRSVNGVVKAHDAGTAVQLFQTPRYGL